MVGTTSCNARDAAGDANPSGRVAGIDFGTVRIGVAIGDFETRIAAPLTTYTRRNEIEDAQFFQRLVREHDVVRFVVGLPVHLSGDESQKSHQARQFGQWLIESTQVDVEFFDERYTTVEAEQLLEAAGLTAQKRKTRRDQLAAQIMLTAYFEAGGQGRDKLGPLDDNPQTPAL